MNVSVDDLEGLQEKAALSGFIVDPVFYSGKAGANGKYILGAIFQSVSPSGSEAIVSSLSAYSDLVEELVGSDDLFDDLIHFSVTNIDSGIIDATTEGDKEAEVEDQKEASEDDSNDAA